MMTELQTENVQIESEVKEIIMNPKDYQVKHLNNIINHVRRWFIYYDTSPTGAGKTFISLCIAVIFKLDVIVIGPLTVLEVWRRESYKYGINLIDAISYTTLAGYRNNLIEENTHNITPFFKKCINTGTLIIFDEAHFLKNKSTKRLVAAQAIIKCVIETNSSSRIGLLSATPGDKVQHLESIFKILGLTTKNNLCNYNRQNAMYETSGLTDVFNFCRPINPSKIGEIQGRLVNNKTIYDICKDLFIDVIKNYCTFSMGAPKISATLDVKNGNYTLGESDTQRLQQKMTSLMKVSININFPLNKINVGFNQITTVLEEVENAKSNIFIKLTRNILHKNPKAKVIIYTWYKSTCYSLSRSLVEYSPMVLNGDTKNKERTTTIHNFQRPDSQFRLIISNPTVGGIGISLDDQHGQYPRYILCSPSYKLIDLHQAVGRIYRVTTKSKATVRFIYCKDAMQESRILNSIIEKSNTVKYILHDKIILPGDYETVTEENDNDEFKSPPTLNIINRSTGQLPSFPTNLQVNTQFQSFPTNSQVNTQFPTNSQVNTQFPTNSQVNTQFPTNSLLIVK